jgi:hypothetical protein
MKTTAAALLISLLAQSYVLAGEPNSLNTSPWAARFDQPLTRAIVLEATRLSRSLPVQPVQMQDGADTRHWCRRHPIRCSTLVGLGAGFVVGAIIPQGSDPCCGPITYGLTVGAYGAGIGAGVGWVIATATKPQQP